ncbi:MAG: IS66 family transposase [Usitatibacteraceae bacterium]
MTLALENLPDDVAALKAIILAARAETAVLTIANVKLENENLAFAGENLRLKFQNERFAHILRALRRAHFGRSSEKISDDQLNLALDDVQTGFAVENAKAENANEIIKGHAVKTRRANRGHLPAHLPREDIVVEPEAKSCPCCGGDLHVIGEDTSERLDKIPAKLRVIVTRRPKYACRTCTDGVVQAPAPDRLIAGGLPTEALVADVLVSKYADHLPLYRQAQILAREGVTIDRSTLCHWVGTAAVELEPLHARLVAILKSSSKLFCDETRCPVLDPGRGKTKTGYLWAIARDDRPWGGGDPPAVAYTYAPGRGGEHARALLAGFNGTLQVDGYAGYNGLADANRPGGAVTLAFCWSHFRRQFYDIAKGGNAPIAREALDRIGALYGIETEIRGQSADQRRSERQAQTLHLVEDLKTWLGLQLTKVPRRAPIAEAIRYGVNHWGGLCRFLDNGRVEIDSNTVERSIRPIALNRKNALFAGSDEGGTNWAIIASLIETCKLNGVNPHAWLADTLTKLVNRWPASRIDDLMPWTYAKIPA